MHSNDKNESEEIMILGHDPWPGYRPVFYVVFAIGVLYLAFIFLNTL
ncbi:MAG: hypothetical protein SCH72_00080 [Desulfuromonadales bacterium]|nr:hypothetical protein [Desulfuromonadales bacterium]